MPRIVPFLAIAIVGSLPGPLIAQDAAETAIILSTGTAQVRAQRSLGNSIARSMGNAANAVAATTSTRSQARTHRRTARRTARGAGKFAIALPADVDPLENTDAPSYELANGATIRVSGGLRPPVRPAEDKPPP